MRILGRFSSPHYEFTAERQAVCFFEPVAHIIKTLEAVTLGEAIQQIAFQVFAVNKHTPPVNYDATNNPAGHILTKPLLFAPVRLILPFPETQDIPRLASGIFPDRLRFLPACHFRRKLRLEHYHSHGLVSFPLESLPDLRLLEAFHMRQFSRLVSSWWSIAVIYFAFISLLPEKQFVALKYLTIKTHLHLLTKQVHQLP